MWAELASDIARAVIQRAEQVTLAEAQYAQWEEAQAGIAAAASMTGSSLVENEVTGDCYGLVVRSGRQSMSSSVPAGNSFDDVSRFSSAKESTDDNVYLLIDSDSADFNGMCRMFNTMQAEMKSQLPPGSVCTNMGLFICGSFSATDDCHSETSVSMLESAAAEHDPLGVFRNPYLASDQTTSNLGLGGNDDTIDTSILFMSTAAPGESALPDCNCDTDLGDGTCEILPSMYPFVLGPPCYIEGVLLGYNRGVYYTDKANILVDTTTAAPVEMAAVEEEEEEEEPTTTTTTTSTTAAEEEEEDTTTEAPEEEDTTTDAPEEEEEATTAAPEDTPAPTYFTVSQTIGQVEAQGQFSAEGNSITDPVEYEDFDVNDVDRALQTMCGSEGHEINPQDGTTWANMADYRGCQNQTKAGEDCLNWSDYPSMMYSWKVEKLNELGLGNHNFCRNPFGRNPGGLYCITAITGNSIVVGDCEPLPQSEAEQRIIDDMAALTVDDTVIFTEKPDVISGMQGSCQATMQYPPKPDASAGWGTTTVTTTEMNKVDPNCLKSEEAYGQFGEDYRGCLSTTMGGDTCADWATAYKSQPGYDTIMAEPDMGGNYCRNFGPGGNYALMPFCYVKKDSGFIPVYCDIPALREEPASKVVENLPPPTEKFYATLDFTGNSESPTPTFKVHMCFEKFPTGFISLYIEP